MATYTYLQGEKIHGPCTMDLIQREISSGRLTHAAIITSVQTGRMMSVGDAVLAEASEAVTEDAKGYALLQKRLRCYGRTIFLLGWVVLMITVFWTIYLCTVSNSLMALFSISPFLPAIACLFMGLMLQGMAALVEKD